eukprot:scaffold7825_cov87-Cylindrotheca_fusiformis.AAC.2
MNRRFYHVQTLGSILVVQISPGYAVGVKPGCEPRWSRCLYAWTGSEDSIVLWRPLGKGGATVE